MTLATVALLLGAPVLGANVAAPQGPPAPPRRFERVLWCGTAERTPVAKALGFTAVQLGRGGDPAPIRAAGLGFYLDQPIGKGVLELRDEQWQPIHQAYERTRDPSVLVRPGCFATPGLVEAQAAAAAAEVERVRGPGLLFVALADEASATRHDAPLDTCRCVHCTAAFRAFARRRFGDIGALNRALGTQFATFDDVSAPLTDPVRRRELGDVNLPADLQPFGVRQDFVDEQFADAVRSIAAKVREIVPDVPVGLTGLQAPGAFGGGDPARVLPALTLAEPYAIAGAPELARSLLPPGSHRYATLFPPGEGSEEARVPLDGLVRAQLAAMAFQGLAGVVVWNDATVADAAAAPTPFGRAVVAAVAQLEPVLDACAGAAQVSSPVWVLESQASVRTWWMLDSAGDGATWIRRLSSYEQQHSTSQSARLGWIRLLQDLGMQPRFVAESALPERLLQERPRCLVLPATIALGDRAAQAITAFVRTGGVLLADHSPALYDDALRRRAQGALDELFGVTRRSLAWSDLLVRQGRSTARASGLPIAERGLAGRIAQRHDDGDAFVESFVGRGRAVCLNAPVCEYGRWRLDEQQVAPARELRRRVRAVLQQAAVPTPFEIRGEGLPTCLERAALRLRDGRLVLAARISALDAPLLLHRLAERGPCSVQIELPSPMTLSHLGGAPIGGGTRFELPLDPFGGLFLEVRR